MRITYLTVVAVGLWIGWLWPQDRPAAPARAATATAEEQKEVLLEKRGSHFYADVLVNGQTVRMMIDTGASMVAIGPEHAERLGIKFDRAQFGPIARTADGIAQGMEVTFDTVAIEGKKVSHVRGAIIEGLDMPLLGQAYLGRMSSVEMAGDYMRIE